MSLRALLYAYILGGLTFIPLVLIGLVSYTIYTSVPVSEAVFATAPNDDSETTSSKPPPSPPATLSESNDTPKSRKGWLTMRRTFEESTFDGGYVTLVRSFLDARSKDPKRSRPKDMWYVVLKGKVLYLYEDEGMTECEAAIELGSHEVIIYPEGQLDGELFAKRNALCLRPKAAAGMHSITKEMKLEGVDVEAKLADSTATGKKREKEKEVLADVAEKQDAARSQAFNQTTPWFIFVRSTADMEDWYLSLVHASDHPAQTPTLAPLQEVFLPPDMDNLVSTLDDQPDVIPMRWLNALFGRIFYSFYRTEVLEAFIIGRLMKKLSKVKRPAFLTDIVVTEVSVGNKTPLLSKPMLKELTKEGDASMEVHLQYKGEFRITIEATAIINLGARFKSYTVKLVLAAVLKELEGNLLVKVKRPPSNRIWYAFTQPPKMVLEVEPVVSDRQITWTMILSTIESRLKEIIQESVVMPNMDDISFFETADYEHRGGIWSDAGRRLGRRPTTGVESEGETYDPTASTMSEPLPDIQDESIEPLKKSESSQEISTSTELASDERPANSTPSLPLDTSTVNRRRSLLSQTLAPPINEPLLAEPEPARGRPSEITADKLSVSRSRSSHSASPSQNGSVNESALTDFEDDSVTPAAASGPSSRRSSYKSHGVSDTLEDAPYESPFDSAEPRSKTSDSLLGGRPSSFLSTLKSRAAAADKQAISNTAKEAMRKWGVNWAGLKKDTTEELSDTGSVNSKAESQTSKRTSYAAVRAAVAERKEKERGDLLAINNKPRTASGSSSLAESIRSKRLSMSSSVGNSSEVEELLSSPPPRARTLSQPGEHDGSTPTPNAAPIHVQPQAKTMSIPGIHASHRGEVMSMGYVAPASPPPTTSTNTNPVYRLWKSPAKGPLEHMFKSSTPPPRPSSAQRSITPDNSENQIEETRQTSPDPLNASTPVSDSSETRRPVDIEALEDSASNAEVVVRDDVAKESITTPAVAI